MLQNLVQVVNVRLIQKKQVLIFVDNSIIEIFINKGEKVFTSRVFPEEGQNGIKIKSGEASGTYFELKY